MSEEIKIGMYTEDEIFEYMTDCEGSMLGRSMYDAIFDKIHALITENQQLKEKLNFDLEWALKYDELYKENQQLSNELRIKNEELRIKGKVLDEIREYINNCESFMYGVRESNGEFVYKDTATKEEMLQILDKVKENERGTTKAS